ncbi:class I SAM-dependent methyltransferase [Terrimonas alba]|uniref:class I SAM-dependent methyltransferase n=1 Tax=Terrimonas alba TaxID=3349636 RepID=UPI0035F35B67
MENINNTYFDGYYKDIWRAIIPPEFSVKEAEFIQQYFNLNHESKVVDVMCGYGRHTIALAQKGVNVTAVDNLQEYINEIKEIAEKKSLPIKAIQADVLRFYTNDIFDLALCMGNSLNFFNANDTSRLLSSIAANLKKKGHLFINTWSLTEIAIKHFKENSWTTVDELKFLNASKYLFHPTRIETESTIIAPNGDTETKTAIDYIFSVAEMEAMLMQAGFSLKEIYSVPGRKKFNLGDSRAYIVAEKI